MKRYLKYKKTSFINLAEIPSQWEFKKLKYLVLNKLTYGANESAEFEVLDDPRYIRITDFGDNGILRNDTFKSLPNEIAKDFLLKEGDILFARSGATVGKTYQFKNYFGLACYAGYLIKASPNYNLILSDFLYYFTKSNDYENWKDSISNKATIQNIGADKYCYLEVPLPPLNEQTTIATYLDQKTTQIDKLITNKQKLIELLKEERTGIINEAVSGKGKNWELKKLSHGFKRIGSGTTPASGNEEYYNGTINWLQTGDLTNGEINLTGKKITQKAIDDYSPLREYPSGSLVVAMYGATIGKVGILKIATTTNQACCVLSEPISFDTMFVFYWFIGNKDYVISRSYGGGQPNISQENIKSFRLPCPSIKEQTTVVAYITFETKRIDTIISKIEKEIDLMQEYRTALISEVVTGKIDVRNYKEQINEPLQIAAEP